MNDDDDALDSLDFRNELELGKLQLEPSQAFQQQHGKGLPSHESLACRCTRVVAQRQVFPQYKGFFSHE